MLIILLGIWLTSTGLLVLVGSSLTNFMETIPTYQVKIEQVWMSLQHFLVDYGIMEQNFDALKQVNPGKALTLVGNVFSGFSSMLSNSILILLVFVFYVDGSFEF